MRYIAKHRHVFLSLALVLGLYFYSLFIRLPHIGSPLNLHHHEWLTAHTLVTLSIWDMAGIQNYHFSPVYTYPHEGDRFVQTTFVGGILTDTKGDMYYLSYPPLGFLLPFLFFKLTFLPVSVFSMQIFNLLLHLIGTVFIYGIINTLRKESFFAFNYGGLIGAVVYLFTPATLWFTLGVYFSDMLVQALWIMGIYLFLRVAQTHAYNGLQFKLLCLVVFLMVYTEWIGVFFAGTVVLYLLFTQRRISRQQIMVGSAVIGALALMFVQYSSIDGFSTYGQVLYEKFLSRSGFGDAAKSDAGITIRDEFARDRVISFYIAGYGVVLTILAFLSLSYFFVHKKITTYFTRSEYLFLLSCLVPIVMHHLLLFNFTAIHDFSIFKAAVFLAIIVGALWTKLVNEMSRPLQILFTLFMGMFILSSGTRVYFEQNAVAAVQDGHVQKVALAMKTEASDDEVVFANHWAFDDPSIIYYAQRNVLMCPDTACVSQKLIELKQKKGVLFVLDPYLNISSITRVENTQ